MDNQRLLLFAALAFIAMLMWQTWQQDYGPKPVEPQATTGIQMPGSTGSADIPQASDGSVPVAVPAGTAVPSATATGSTDVPVRATSLETAQRVSVKTDVFHVIIDTRGGDIRQLRLPGYPVSQDQPDEPFTLLDDASGKVLYVAQSGLIGTAAPDHHAIYQAEAASYQLAEGKDKLQVVLNWKDESGVQVAKIYTFTRGSYNVDIEHRVTNGSEQAWSGRLYRQLQRSLPEESGNRMIYTYTGGVIYSEEEKYEKIDFSDMEDSTLSRDIKGGWAAMIQHYFVTVWVPVQDQTNHFYTKVVNGSRYILGMVGPQASLPAGQTHNFKSIFTAGPKIQDDLGQVATGLDLTVDYGILTVLAKPLFWLLQKIHSFVGNWGWAIIFLTMLIKLVFYKLSEASYKSMANMRRMQPRIQTMRERYGNDKTRLNQSMMELYKKEKINPMGGCLPILVQIPVFIALYWVLLESVELRQAGFALWITDLSEMDPYFVLPVIMGASMFIQQRLNPTPPDPIQAKVMMMLPFIFTFMFLWFPSGLVLYWVVNNTLSIAQQWVITRRIEKMAAAK